ncbi:MAG: hypothetical protein V3575_00320, partial [Candidatus Absconditabacteria bacterium]
EEETLEIDNYDGDSGNNKLLNNKIYERNEKDKNEILEIELRKEKEKAIKLVKEKNRLLNENKQIKQEKESDAELISQAREIFKIKNLISIIIVEGESDKILLETFFELKGINPLIIIGGSAYGVYFLLKTI